MSVEIALGRRIRELRKEKNLSQRELAKRVDLNFTYLSKIENGIEGYLPSADAIESLAKALDADPDELFALAGKVPKDLGEALKLSIAKVKFYRSVVDLNLSDEDLEKLSQKLKNSDEDS